MPATENLTHPNIVSASPQPAAVPGPSTNRPSGRDEVTAEQGATGSGSSSYISSEDVSQDVYLRPGAQEVELVETTEVPVVRKYARVVEEVHISKVGADRTVLVEDSLRHNEVEFEPVGAAWRGPGAPRT